MKMILKIKIECLEFELGDELEPLGLCSKFLFYV